MKVLVYLGLLLAAASAAPDVGIVGGNDAPNGQFYYQVSLQFCTQTLCQHVCGGTIISHNWIITAAHCFTDAPTLGGYQIVAGVNNLNATNATNPDRELISIRLVYIYPLYQGGIGPHDIAAVKLAEPLEFNDNVGAIPLPDPDHQFAYDAVVSGWGSNGNNYPNTLQYATVPILQIEDCRAALDALLGDTPHPLNDDVNICTGPLSGGLSTCTGDAGSPLYQPARNFLYGIVSWGITPCGLFGSPSIYTKVSYYNSWLKSVVDDFQ